MTEQGAFLDGLDSNADREDGARDSLDKLAAYLLTHDPEPAVGSVGGNRPDQGQRTLRRPLRVAGVKR